ncbi:MAG: L-threonylcarbamoyladenylate synthase [Gemmatimonadaceae bacterium]
MSATSDDSINHSPKSPTILTIDPSMVTIAALEVAGRIIREGGLVAFPTETVYGLGANALDSSAVNRIFTAKGRPAFNPIIVHVLDLTGASTLAAEVPDVAQELAEAFWPGPLTLVMRRRALVPDAVTAGLDTVGVRAPAHPVARALLAAAQVPIAAPSANRYTRLSPTTAAHVISQLGERVDMVIDGGESSVGIESTVVDVSGDCPILLRPGGLSRATIEKVVGPIAVVEQNPVGDAPRPAPGMVERHYAPNARIVFLDAGDGDEALRQLQSRREHGERVGVVAYNRAIPDGEVTCRLPADAAGYAKRLYAALHTLDDASCSTILIERVPSGSEWDAVADRLRRAASQPMK